MVKVKGRLTNKKRIGPAVFSKRTIKKSGGDNFEQNVRSKGVKSKKSRRK